jgi:hypothetical protein
VRVTRGAVGRILAAAVGVEWFVLLLFGPGLLFGPMAWLAAALGRAMPRLSAILLLVPAGLLVLAWLPALFDTAGTLSLGEAGVIVLVLSLPAAVAAALIASQPSRGNAAV